MTDTATTVGQDAIDQLTDDEQTTLTRLQKQWEAKRERNLLRAAYYDGKHAATRMSTMALPPQFMRIATILGWPAKAVDALNTRCHLERFVSPGQDVDDLGVTEVWDDNNLAAEIPQAHLSALIHAVAWLVVTAGDEGEPDAIITVKDAMSATGLWNYRSRRVDAFLSILGYDSDQPDRIAEQVLYLPEGNIYMVKEGGVWSVDRDTHDLGRVPVEPLVFKPRVNRPYGSSRISRAVMSMTDLAMRCVMRSEITAELYSVPQRVLMGADESDFKNADGSIKAAWQVVFGRIWAIGRDEDGELPRLEQLQQASQGPHMEQLRALAQLFAGETSIPIASLGISGEANPTSAEAYYASREDLIALAEAATDGWGPAWSRAMRMALQLKNGTAPDELRPLRAQFRSPAHTSRAAAADAMLKAIQAFPWLAESDTAVELLGFDELTTERLLADKRKAAARRLIQSLTAPVPAPPQQPPPGQAEGPPGPRDVNTPIETNG